MPLTDDEFYEKVRAGEVASPSMTGADWGDHPILGVVPLKTAGDLLDAFNMHRGVDLWDRIDHRWIFRGQGEAVWKLQPTAQRPGAFDAFCRKPPTTPADRRDIEVAAVFDFASYASMRGLEVPGDTQALRDQDGPPSYSLEPENFPGTNLRAMFALAQHYGLPTRLLDWTFSPLVASYFAAVRVAQRLKDGTSSSPQSDGSFAVWAVELQFLEHVARRWDPGAALVTVPGSSNPNLQAQQGVFTLVRYSARPPVDAEIPTLDELCVDSANVRVARVRRGNRDVKMLHKFTLPHSEAPALLTYLDGYGVNASTVFPGHRSVVDYMLEAGIRSERPWLRRPR